MEPEALHYNGWCPDMKPVNLISYGAGEDSTALILLVVNDARLALYRKGLQVVFSDTRAELPETYTTIEHMKAYCAERAIPFEHLRPIMRSKDGAEHEGLEAYCLHLRVIPAKRSDHRWCTDRIKIVPIHRWVRAAFPGRPINIMIGFGAEEAGRQARAYAAKNDPSIKVCFPLIEVGFCRHRCGEYIAQSGFPGPVLKSGCFFCPFAKKRYWKWLKQTHPNLFERAMAMEEGGRGFARGFSLSHKPLRELVTTPDRARGTKACVCGRPMNEYWGCGGSYAT